MIQEVIEYINTSLSSEFDYYKNYYGLCELIKRDNITFPAQYCNKEYKNLDIEKPIIYHRIVGDISISYDTDEETATFDEYIIKEIPLKLVSILDKNTFGKSQNDAYFESKILENITNTIAVSNVSSLAKLFNIDVVSITPKNGTVLRTEFNTEYTGTKELNLNYCIVTLEYDVVLSGLKKCFTRYGC